MTSLNLTYETTYGEDYNCSLRQCSSMKKWYVRELEIDRQQNKSRNKNNDRTYLGVLLAQ